MNRDRLSFGIIGLIVGLILGFMFANSVNRSTSTSAEAGPPALTSGSNPALPPNHPPISDSEETSQTGALPEVTAAIEKARRSPGDFEAQMTAGDLYYQIQRFEGAIEFYEKASKLQPDADEPLIKLGNTYFDSEEYENAARSYGAILKRTPNDVNVRTDLGLTFYLRTPRDIDRAIKEYTTSLDIKPDHEVTLQNLAIAYDEKGDAPNLQKTLDKLSQVNPNNPTLLKKRN